MEIAQEVEHKIYKTKTTQSLESLNGNPNTIQALYYLHDLKDCKTKIYIMISKIWERKSYRFFKNEQRHFNELQPKFPCHSCREGIYCWRVWEGNFIKMEFFSFCEGSGGSTGVYIGQT